MSTSIEKLAKIGSSLGLSGTDLKNWIETTVKEEDDRKQREIGTEKAKTQREMEIERERAKLETERLKEEAALVTLQLELQQRRNESNETRTEVDVEGVSHVKAIRLPKLPSFQPGHDNLHDYLQRFERYARVNGWMEEDWATHLSALLTGSALEVYSRLNDEEANNYSVLKASLLKRYNLTEDGFLEKFRKSRPESGESIEQFTNRISSYFCKWVEMAGKDRYDVHDVTDLLIKEQLMNVCGRELLIFVKERKPTDSKSVMELIGKYVDAHGSMGAYTRPQMVKTTVETDNHKRVRPETLTYKGPIIPHRNGPITCHICKKVGHMAKDCRSKPKVAAIDVTVSCDYCKKRGHLVKDCWKKQNDEKKLRLSHNVASVTVSQDTNQNKSPCSHKHLELKCGCELPVTSASCLGSPRSHDNMPVAEGLLNGTPVTVLRDSGCSCVVVKKGLVEGGSRGTRKVPVLLADGSARETTTVDVTIDCPYFSGDVSAVEMENPLYEVILGNIPGAKCPDMCGERSVLAVETRNAKYKRTKPLMTSQAPKIDVTSAELKAQQAADTTLVKTRDLATSGEVKITGKENKHWYGYTDGVLYRHYLSPNVHHGNTRKQVVVPKGLRTIVMKLAHESVLGGHLAAKKTTERIQDAFYWPNMWTDVRNFCRSCDVCQRCAPKGQTPKVPLQGMPLIETPFSPVAVDLVGPIVPASERGYRYVLTVVCYCTRYPEAVALKNINTETVAEGLVDIFSRTGVPNEILSDRGTQFTSELMAEVCRLLSIRQLMTTPYHPQCNGLVERFNGTLKAMLKRLSSDRPRDWDRYLNAALFAYREAPQESLGFSPFELLFGRTVRGPMTILKELWTKDIDNPEVKTTYQYVVDLNERIEATLKVAHENLNKASKRYRAHFDRHAKARTFKAGDKVLLLLPTKQNKLELKWQGPFNVVCQTHTNNYRINLGTTEKVYHANLLKKYFERESGSGGASEEVGLLMCASAAVVEERDESSDVPAHLELPSLSQTKTVEDVAIGDVLDKGQKDDLSKLLYGYQDVLTDIPGRTHIYSYDIKLTSSEPVRKKPYPVPQAMKETLREEVRGMLKAGIIEPSDSPYCSPSVVVRKKDGTNRYCVDFRALNNLTVFDAEPMPQLDDLFQQIGQCCDFVSKIDLSKGYWQIPLTEKSKPLTAFATELGLMSFTVMPFGLQCAPAAFSRLMRKVLGDLDHVKNFIDDIIIHTKTWAQHIDTLRNVFQRLRHAGLTARPTKCLFGYKEVEFLGHRIGSGRLAPTVDKVEAIRKALPPETKKQLRSFLGLASFYRRYVPNFAAVTSPLTDATRKGKPNRVVWEEALDRSFNYIKEKLSSEPVLRLPDFEKTFILATDASDTGLGAVLLQEYNGIKYPVMYLSRKLLSNERNYSVVERECLALVWSVKTLNSYLLGREFIIETDHAPLLYLNRAKSENGRLMRWSLLLHQYRFKLRSVKGTENHGPDYLSRLA